MKEYSYIKKALLRELSSDSSSSITELAHRIKCSRSTVMSNMEFLEREFGMRYTIEFNREVLGFVKNQIVLIKFGIMPEKEYVEEIFAGNRFLPFVAETSGDFDMLIGIVYNTTDEFLRWRSRTLHKLLRFRPSIRASYVTMINAGFLAIPNGVLEKLSLDLLGLDSLDTEIILQLNENARLTNTKIAEKLKVDVETVRYRIRKILKTNLIVRFTIVLTKPPTQFNVAFALDYSLGPNTTSAYYNSMSYYKSIDGNLPVVNAFPYLAAVSGRYYFFGIGCFYNEEEAVRDVVLKHRDIFKDDNLEMAYARITNVISGYLPIRNMSQERGLTVLNMEDLIG
jgi:DNA-binding Lrp family transcriptional regulator